MPAVLPPRSIFHRTQTRTLLSVVLSIDARAHQQHSSQGLQLRSRQYSSLLRLEASLLTPSALPSPPPPSPDRRLKMSSPPGDSPKQGEEQEDDDSWVNDELLKEVLGPDTQVLDIQSQRATSKGDNFLSVIYRTNVKYRTRNSDEVKEKHFIVKGLPPGDFLRKYIKELQVFERELVVYNKLNELYAFADSRLVDLPFKRISVECYESSRPDTVILEDLKPRGFINAPRRERLDFAHAKLVVQNLARLHALSVACSEVNTDFLSQFEDTVYAQNNRERLLQFFVPVFKGVIEAVKGWEGFSEMVDKLEGKDEIYVDRVIELVNAKNAFRTVLIHGDCWVNNILFKYSDTGDPIDLCFVDFQLTREASPGIDLHYFLYSSLQRNTRRNHWNDLLQEYCDEFERSAMSLGYRGSIITYDEISQEMERLNFFGFLCTISIGVLVSADPEDSPDMSSVTEDQMQEGDSQHFNKLYASSTFREDFQIYLPFFNKLGVLD